MQNENAISNLISLDSIVYLQKVDLLITTSYDNENKYKFWNNNNIVTSLLQSLLQIILIRALREINNN